MPVVIGAALVVPLLLLSLVFAPIPTLLPLPTLALVLAAFVWFDRLEPEPWSERIHAVLWGATIAIVVSGIVNTVAMLLFGEVVAVVLSAPLVEETMKAGGLLYVLRRGKIDGVMDGVVYAGWIAAGFAAVENVEYFVTAATAGELGTAIVLRGVLAPFAHPLFTLWVGAAIGRAVARGTDPVVGALPGLLVAIVLHALWNGTIVLAGGRGIVVGLLVVVAFVALFAVTAVLLVVERARARRALARTVPLVAARYGLTAAEVEVFSDWRRTLAVRRRLSSGQRPAFDAQHAAIARLVALLQRPHPPDPAAEARLVARLHAARSAG